MWYIYIHIHRWYTWYMWCIYIYIYIVQIYGYIMDSSGFRAIVEIVIGSNQQFGSKRSWNMSCISHRAHGPWMAHGLRCQAWLKLLDLMAPPCWNQPQWWPRGVGSSQTGDFSPNNMRRLSNYSYKIGDFMQNGFKFSQKNSCIPGIPGNGHLRKW